MKKGLTERANGRKKVPVLGFGKAFSAAPEGVKRLTSNAMS